MQFVKANPLVQFVEICLKLNAPYEFHSFNAVEEGADCKFRGHHILHLTSKISISYVVLYVGFNILCMHVYLKKQKHKFVDDAYINIYYFVLICIYAGYYGDN